MYVGAAYAVPVSILVLKYCIVQSCSLARAVTALRPGGVTVHVFANTYRAHALHVIVNVCMGVARARPAIRISRE